MEKLKIYSASAGAGKTYTLTQEYLKLVFVNPSYYKRILAVTFTNKATEEMKSRIIESLADLAKGSQEDHYPVIAKHIGKSGRQVQYIAQEILSNILHDYSHFAVTTIDSFFQKVLKGFVKELGVHGGFNIELDQDKVIETITKNMISKIGEDRQLRSWIFDFVNDNVEKGKSWNVKSTLQELGKEVLAENFRIIESKGFGSVKDTDALRVYLEKLKVYNEKFVTHLEVLGKKALAMMQEHSLVYLDFSYGKSGFASYFVKMSEKCLEAPSKRVLEAVDTIDKWSSKKSEKKEAIESIYFNGLNALLKEIIQYYFDHIHYYNSNQSILDSIYVYGVYNNLISELQDYRNDQGVLMISDISALLNDIIGQNNAPYIYEKVGSFYKHYLIDEFQDTSNLQWFNFKPLLENGLGEGKGSLIVGDVKQAIYRWRGGDWRLLLEGVENDIGEEWIEKDNLPKNYRSTKEVIRFNNTLFKAAPQILESYFENELLSVREGAFSDDWKERYDLMSQYFSGKVSKAYVDAFQEFPGNKLDEGNVQLRFWEKEKESTFHEFLRIELKSVIDVLLSKGECLKDMAILVRSKREAKWIADCLQSYNKEGGENSTQYNAIVSGALRYESNLGVRVLLKAMRYLQEPNDRINLYELLNLSLEIKGGVFQSIEFMSVDEKNIADYLPEEFIQQQARLSKMPVYELIQLLMIHFKLVETEENWPYFQSFNDIVVNYTRSNNPDLSSFLKFWKESGGTKSPVLSDDQDAIQIQTIHKSKGLQYKHVMIPFCNWSFHHNPRHTNLIWAYSDEDPYQTYPYFPVDYKKGLERSVYSMHYFDEMLQVLMENLNILYVACTRAENSLICFGEKSKKRKDKIASLNASDVLLDLMQFKVEGEQKWMNCSSYWSDDFLVFDYGNGSSIKKVSKDYLVSDYQLKRYVIEEYREKLSIRKKSERFFNGQSNDGQLDAVNYGLLMHEVLAEINVLEDLEKVLAKKCQEGRLKLSDLPKVKEQVSRLLLLPEMKGWYSDRWVVKNEQLIIDPNSSYDKRPDRVLVDGDEAVVIDFRFGSVHSSQYKNQVKGYMKVLSQMGYYPVKGYLLYGEEGVVEEVFLQKDSVAKPNQLDLF